jgi:hypothetical protein
MRWAGHVAHIARSGMRIGVWWESQERDLDVGGRKILKLNLDWMVWHGLNSAGSG